MKKHLLKILIFLVVAGCCCVLPGHSSASGPPARTHWQAFELPSDHRPGYQGLLIFWIIPDQDIYTYSHDPGPGGYPTALEILGVLSEELTVYYPPGKMLPDPFEPQELSSLYLGPTPVFIPVPEDLTSGQTLEARASFLLCSDRNCWPVSKEVQYDLDRLALESLPNPEEESWWPRWVASVPGEKESPAPWTGNSEPAAPLLEEGFLFETRSFTPGLEVSSAAKAALLAILAGLILNFMPCVLPVISLKLRGMIPDSAHDQDAAAKRKAFRIHNLFFALGMLLFFSILSVIISLTGMAWGQVFQNPIAIVILAAVVFGLGLSLFGLYDLPIIDLKAGSSSPKKNPNLEALSTGMLATLLATPCSGPFLGGVLAWALTQPPATIAFVLLCVGLGMASPYILMFFFPFMVKFLPKPGNWTLYLEKGLGFLLMATCIYLIALLPETLIMQTLIMFWIIGLGAWMWGKWTSLSQTRLKRGLIRGIAISMMILAAFFLFKPRTYYPAIWMAFDEQKFHQVWGEENFLIEFTADWCPNCKFLEKTVLTPPFLDRIGQDYDLVFLKVDLTYKNPAGEEMLRALDSMSIPLVAIFRKDEPHSPLILRDLFTRNQLLNALDNEFRSSKP
ncbi:protein-disulfide reductase DsbD family protein [Desulfonatronovibrio hydrogenovorans]|uniref:protein-disulfide reductase DsbD family protein n=1 Tax=Desulfonatronovibrio hydrogenovorans TaxID=53245 RepID=UPI00049034C0|nr:cytochrome c biogenesis protein CcdA [Desulfonatronovibrio hydrogenovorans]